jgi:putative effector of murein hydrolase LrgA (UPF0299 family)
MPQVRARVRDAAYLLPVLAIVLFMPPVVTLFVSAHTGLAGVPLIVVYVFGTWLGLIVAAALLARRLG